MFFKLLDTFKEIFDIEPKSIDDLIKKTDDGLGLQLKQGEHIALEGKYKAKNRELYIEFSYNRAFSGKKNYPYAGSWTKNMRPDYTLSIWPYGITQIKAEEEELIVHIHFDAKYKIEKLSSIFGDISDKELKEDELQEEQTIEKNEEIKGTFKRIDLLKMHSYKDAIRRTGGAYILYPGTEDYEKRGFHEIIPGLGAFAISPSKCYDGTKALKKFLNEVIQHFLNRASQREKISLKAFETYNDEDSNIVNESLPETYGTNRNLLPDNTFVLVGYYKNEDQLNWIIKEKLYNARTGPARGSLRLTHKETDAKYLLLHSVGETKTSKFFKLSSKGPRIFSKEYMIQKLYPDPSKAYYVVFDIEGNIEKEFDHMKWDIAQLEGFTKSRGSAIPFSVSLSELMRTLVR